MKRTVQAATGDKGEIVAQPEMIEDAFGKYFRFGSGQYHCSAVFLSISQ